MKRGRILQLAFAAIAVAGSVAYSVAHREVVARPLVAVITVTPDRVATAAIAIAERGGGAVAIDATTRAVSCDPEVTATPTAFVAGGGVTQNLTVACAPLDSFTMKRCAFEAWDGDEAVVGYTGLCIARGTSALSPSTLELRLTAAPNRASPWRPVAFRTPIRTARASVQIDDQDNIFEVKTPCDTPSGCNDFAIHAPFSLAFACHPGDANPHSAHAYVLTDTGAEVNIRLDCNTDPNAVAFAVTPDGGFAFAGGPEAGTDATLLDGPPDTSIDGPPDAPPDAPGDGSGMSADAPLIDAPDAPPFDGPPDAPQLDGGMSMITVLPKAINLTVPVGGNGSADVTFSEIGTAPVTINFLTLAGTGSSQWTVTPQAPCSVIPCTLGPGMSAIFHVVYHPTIPNVTDNATLTFTSTDPTSPSVVTLVGMATPANANLALVTANPLDFGGLPVNQTVTLPFTLANSGTAPLPEVDYGTLLPPFALVSPPTSIPPGSQASGGITCHPTSSGRFTQTLHITAPGAAMGSPIDLLLICSTPPKIVAMPTTVSLATQVATLATTIVTLTNIGFGDLSISSFGVTGGNGWSAVLGSQCPSLPCVLAANQSVDVDLSFTPPMLGASSASLDVYSDDPMTPKLTVPLDGTGLGATLGSSVSTLDFGAPVVGSFSQRFFQLTNAGNVPANVTYSLVGSVFSIDVQPMSVPPTGAMVTLRCTPAAVTSYTGTLTVASSNALSGSPVTVNLTCAGSVASASPKLEVSPPSLTVQANVGGAPSVTMLDLSDSGAMPLTISSIAKLGSGTWSFASMCTAGCSLAASSGSHQALTVTYTPTAIAASDVAMLQIVSTDPMSPTTVVLTGTGLGATFAVNPSSLDFATVPVGSSSPKTLQLDNAGNVQLTGITYTPPGPPFSLDQGPTTVEVGTPAIVRLSCAPTVTGVASGNLTIHVPNATPPTTAVIPLTCNGQSGGLVAFPTSLDFGEIRIGDTTPRTKQSALSSTGAALALTAQPMLATPVPGLTVGTVPMTITTTPASFDVTYTPPAHDTTFATTIAATAGNTATVAVSGKVVTPAVDGDVTMEVYAGAWCLNQPTTPTTVVLTSTGTATLHVAQPALQMNTAFALSDVMPAMAGYPFVLASGGTVSVAVQPHQSGTAAHVTDMLAWNADLPSAAITPIVADFVSDGGVAQPSVLEFEVAVNKSDTKIVSLQNCQTLPLAFTNARITPDDVFSIDAQPPPSLLPGVVGAVAIKFTPKKVGVVTGTLTIDAPTGPLTVELHAAGLGGTGTSGTPATFYGCGCRSSDPRGASVLLGAIALVLRRRRSRR